MAGLFEVVSRILESSDEKLRLAGSDILMCTLTHDPASLRNFLAGAKGRPLFAQLMRGMLTPSEGGLQAQLLEMMRMLLDSDSMEAVSGPALSWISVAVCLLESKLKVGMCAFVRSPALPQCKRAQQASGHFVSVAKTSQACASN